MRSKVIKGAFVQTRPRFGRNEENIDGAIMLASKIKSDVYVFPELCNTGYAFTSKRECLSLAESLENGISVEKFQSFAEKNKCTLVAGLAEKQGQKAYNSSIVIERGKILGTYRKMHLFFREKLWFSRSSSGFKTFDVNSLRCRLGVLICFDWFFPEATRCLALQGADVICHPSNLVLPGKAQVGMTVRAFENRVFTITANRVGDENRSSKDKFHFTGRSQIISPRMENLASANSVETVCRGARMDLTLARRKMVTSMNNLLEDRRKVFY